MIENIYLFHFPPDFSGGDRKDLVLYNISTKIRFQNIYRYNNNFSDGGHHEEA